MRGFPCHGADFERLNPLQADFESRSRTPLRARDGRGNGHRGSGVNAVPLGRHDPPEPEAIWGIRGQWGDSWRHYRSFPTTLWIIA